MLPSLNWRSDAVVRLLVSIFICMYAGSIFTATVEHISSGKPEAKFFLVAVAGIGTLAAALVLIRNPFASPRPGRRLAIAMACFYAGMMCGIFAQKLAGASSQGVVRMIISSFCLQGATIALMYFFTREHGASLTDAFGLRTRPQWCLLYGIMLAGLFLPIAWLLQHWSVELLKLVPGLDPQEQIAVQTLRKADGMSQRVALGVITIVFAPLAEEFLFRGVLYKWIRQFGYPQLALWGTSLLFAAAHFNLASFVPLALFGAALAWLYQRNGNLLASIAAHATFNTLNFSLLYLMERMEQATLK